MPMFEKNAGHPRIDDHGAKKSKAPSRRVVLTRVLRAALAAALVSLAQPACGPESAENFNDASTQDSGLVDGGDASEDAGMDADLPDTGTPVIWPKDAGQPDAGEPDAGQPDVGAPDVGTPDSGQPDVGEPDAGVEPPDAGEPDGGAEPPDAGAPEDAGEPGPDAGVNHAPEVVGLTSNPNPVSAFDLSAISFGLNDPDGDDVDWELSLANPGIDAFLSNPSSGTCDTATHCFGKSPSGTSVTTVFSSGLPTNATATVTVDDGKGGTTTTTPYWIYVQ